MSLLDVVVSFLEKISRIRYHHAFLVSFLQWGSEHFFFFFISIISISIISISIIVIIIIIIIFYTSRSEEDGEIRTQLRPQGGQEVEGFDGEGQWHGLG